MRILFLIVFLLVTNNVDAQQFLWRYRTHATDCTSLTDGKTTDLCYEQDAQTLYKCVPTSGDCSGSEWKLAAGGLASSDINTSAEIAAIVSDETGTGSLVFSNSPVFTTPNIGSATGSVSGNAGTATALAANGTNCSAGSYPLGVDASGAVESCTTVSSDKISEGNTEAEVVDTGSDGNFKVTTEGVERLRVTSSGYVGIATTAPATALQVDGAVTINNVGTDIILENSEYIDNGTDDYIYFGGGGGSSNTLWRMTLDGNPSFLSSTGIFFIGGYGQTNNENMQINCETTSNRCVFSSGTGASVRFDNQLIMASDNGLFFGTTSSPLKIATTATGNDNGQFGTVVNASTGSGHFTFMEQADMANANRSPSSLTTDPTIRVYGADATSSVNYIDISHDGTDAKLNTGTGNLTTNAGITSSKATDLGWSVVDGTDNTACTSQCTSAAVFGLNLSAGATAPNMVGASDATADICLCAGGS